MRLGPLGLRIAKLRQSLPRRRPGGWYVPPFPEPRKTAGKALVSVIQAVWIGAIPPRRVAEPGQARGFGGISKRHVAKLCQEIDEQVNAFPERPIEGGWRCGLRPPP